jgi:hypothetical protein
MAISHWIQKRATNEQRLIRYDVYVNNVLSNLPVGSGFSIVYNPNALAEAVSHGHYPSGGYGRQRIVTRLDHHQHGSP